MESTPNVILTAADAFYFRTFCQFAYTFHKQKEYENSELICYDLGFEDDQLEHIEKLKREVPRLSFRKFDFSKYPDFVGLEHKTYSFKPIIVKEVFEEKKCNLLWLDSATVLFDSLSYVWREIDQHGVYGPISGVGLLGEWTVQQTLDYMNVPESYLKNRNICGCMCGFGYQNETVRLLVSEWENYSLVHECIKPVGADRSNHRDDQSLLTILLYKYRDEKGLYMTKDEVDISSTHPVKYLSVRNKLKPSFPFALNFLSVAYYTLHRKIDILVNQIKS